MGGGHRLWLSAREDRPALWGRALSGVRQRTLGRWRHPDGPQSHLVSKKGHARGGRVCDGTTTLGCFLLLATVAPNPVVDARRVTYVDHRQPQGKLVSCI
jgi:hypothetical protein